MEFPSYWELFQNVLVGTIAGVMATNVQKEGTLFVMVSAFLFWVILVLGLRITKPAFEWAENHDDDEEDRPYEDVIYAS
ncbi:hypothetical protein [Haloferax profundi]|uniref:Uncharacterized protein n=1 Tax=Haloferax profundi TaxID=1544718 RepID=A0A0W1SW03_9EURY|nr:hypothetical protein [Haloferax profundi]KTG30648.1 hypothetical protein AUR66_06855 [Haloferax profundi]